MSSLPNPAWARFNDLADAQRFIVFHVLLIGLGRVGMAILRHLLSLPFVRITAIEHDTISERDALLFPASTHERYKVRAAKELVSLWRPDITFNGVLMKVEPSRMRRLQKLVAQSHLILWNADDWQALRQSVSVFHSHAAAVGVGMAQQGAYAEVAWSVPGQTACLACSLRAHEKVSEGGAPNFALDVDAVANVAVRVACGIVLAGHRGFEHFNALLDPRHSLIVVQNRDNAFTSSGNPLVPSLVRLVAVEASCEVCRARRLAL